MGQMRNRPPTMRRLDDDGCHLHPACLECPEPECIFIVGARYVATRDHYAAIQQLRATGLSPDQIAAQLDISRRTVFRALQEGASPMVTASQPRRCPRCNNQTQRMTTLDGPADKCLGCGHEVSAQALIPIEGSAEARPAQRAGIALTHVASDTWVQAATQALREQIGIVAQIEQAREEAERTHRALTAYGAKGVPELPWRPAKKAALPRQTNVTRRTCCLCGREAPPAAFVTVGDGLVCRKAVACAERAKARAKGSAA